MAGPIPITVNVTPVERDGNVVMCDITEVPPTGGYVIGGVIFLPDGPGDSFQINFDLQPGNGVVGWDTQNPFWSRNGGCPRGKGNSPQLNPGAPVGNRLTVNAARLPGPGKNVEHYRLNFNGGRYCDPIIING
jgi:hypothetical protein